MAHVTVEWTDNLEKSLDRSALLQRIAQHMREESGGLFPIGGIRVRALRLDEYVIADGLSSDDAFINIVVRMGVGRTEEVKRVYFDDLFDCVKQFLEPIFAERPLALSLYVDESEGWKHNTIHQRLARAKS